MNILMITPYLPYPPSSGGQVRSYNLIKNLAGKHKLILISLIKDSQEKQYVKKLKEFCHQVHVFNRPPRPWTLKNVIKTGFSFKPFLVVRNFSQTAQNAMKKIIEKERIDLIHAETFYVMPHIFPTKVSVLLVEQTIEYLVYAHFVDSLPWYLIFLKPLLYIDVLKLKFWEKYYWKKADFVVAVSKEDKRKMVDIAPDLEVGIVPNGAGEDLIRVWKKRKPNKDLIVFFQANFNWLQNIEAARNLAKKVFPKIKKKLPKARCWIVGQGAKEKVADLAGLGVEIIDLASSDVDGVIDAYTKAGIFLAPLEGPGGTRLKILAAMAAGVPVVTTKIGIQGIKADNNKHAIITKDWDQMAQATVMLFKNKRLYRKLARQARELVEKHYSYQSISLELDKIYQKVAGA